MPYVLGCLLYELGFEKSSHPFVGFVCDNVIEAFGFSSALGLTNSHGTLARHLLTIISLMTNCRSLRSSFSFSILSFVAVDVSASLRGALLAVQFSDVALFFAMFR